MHHDRTADHLRLPLDVVRKVQPGIRQVGAEPAVGIPRHRRFAGPEDDRNIVRGRQALGGEPDGRQRLFDLARRGIGIADAYLNQSQVEMGVVRSMKPLRDKLARRCWNLGHLVEKATSRDSCLLYQRATLISNGHRRQGPYVHLPFVVIADLQDDQIATLDQIHQPMFFVDSSRPCAG